MARVFRRTIRWNIRITPKVKLTIRCPRCGVTQHRVITAQSARTPIYCTCGNRLA